MALAGLPTSGSLSIGDINVELGLARTTPTSSLNQRELGIPVPLRVDAAPRPDGSATNNAISEWRGYIHRGSIPTTPGTPAYSLIDIFSGDGDTLQWTLSTGGFSIALYEIYVTKDGSHIVTYYTNIPTSGFFVGGIFSSYWRSLFIHNYLARTFGNGTYVFKVRAKDTADQYSAWSSNSPSYTWDSQLQSAHPTSLSASGIDTTEFTLNWVVTTFLEDVTEYKIYMNGSYLKTVPFTYGPDMAETITGLSPSTTYTFTIYAVAGTTMSAASDPLTITTAASQSYYSYGISNSYSVDIMQTTGYTINQGLFSNFPYISVGDILYEDSALTVPYMPIANMYHRFNNSGYDSYISFNSAGEVNDIGTYY